MTISKNVIITGNANIKTALTAFASSRSELNAQANIILCSLINHVHLHGDYTGLMNFIDNFKDGSTEYRAIMAFVKDFSPLRAVRKDGKLDGFKVDKDKVIADFLGSDLGKKMLSVSFLAYKKPEEEKEKPVYVAGVAITKFVERMTKDLEKNGVTLSVEMRNAVNALNELAKVEALEAEKAKAIKALEEKFGVTKPTAE